MVHTTTQKNKETENQKGERKVKEDNLPGTRGGVLLVETPPRLLALNKNLAPQRFQQEVSLFRSNAPLGDHAQNGLAFLLEIILGCWLGCRGTGVPIPVRCWLTFLFARSEERRVGKECRSRL